MAKMSSTYLFHSLGLTSLGIRLSTVSSNSSIYKFATTGDIGEPMAIGVPSRCSYRISWNWKNVVFKQNWTSSITSDTDSLETDDRWSVFWRSRFSIAFKALDLRKQRCHVKADHYLFLTNGHTTHLFDEGWRVFYCEIALSSQKLVSFASL